MPEAKRPAGCANTRAGLVFIETSEAPMTETNSTAAHRAVQRERLMHALNDLAEDVEVREASESHVLLAIPAEAFDLLALFGAWLEDAENDDPAEDDDPAGGEVEDEGTWPEHPMSRQFDRGGDENQEVDDPLEEDSEDRCEAGDDGVFSERKRLLRDCFLPGDDVDHEPPVPPVSDPFPWIGSAPRD